MNRFQVHIVVLIGLLVGDTFFQVSNEEISLDTGVKQKTVYLDRNGLQLNQSYLGEWNTLTKPLPEFPPLLIDALITSEDQRFYDHSGIDFKSKTRAIWSNLIRGGLYQGGSTLSEQTVRILSSRKRTVWNRWIQMWQAKVLEKEYTKEEILEFYLNQVPFASHRRGFHQASRLYFNRDLDTLSKKELLALVVIVKSPSRFDIRKENRIEKSVRRLANKLKLDIKQIGPLGVSDFPLKSYPNVKLYLDFLDIQNKEGTPVIKTTINSGLQVYAESLLRSQLDTLKNFDAHNGGLIIVDHRNGEVLSHAVVNDDEKGLGFDTTLVPRQPGSTLKPFLYTLAFKKGFHTGSLIDDKPLETNVSGGLHQITNYSRHYHGELTLREALGNSLNTPAIKLVRKIGEQELFDTLVKAGIPLQKDLNFYGDGLALGNTEISLMNMMRAWTCLVGRGVCKDLRFFEGQYTKKDYRLFSEEAADMTLDILSDPDARKKEFGRVEFNHQVGFKTGTSTDYRDSWAFVFNSNYLVGVWIGNLDGTSMDEITGSKGPLKVGKALIESRWLKNGSQFEMSPEISRIQVCIKTEKGCEEKEELSTEDSLSFSYSAVESDEWRVQPDTELVHMALDPRIPDHLEVMKFKAKGNGKNNTVWSLNGEKITTGPEYLFNLKKGEHILKAVGENEEKEIKIYVH